MATVRFAFWTRLANALSISRRELNWAAVVAGLVILLTFIPYVYGWAITPRGTVYMGYVFEKNDHSVHSTWVSQAKAGRWLFVDLFTTEPQRPHFFNPTSCCWGGWRGICTCRSRRRSSWAGRFSAGHS